MARLSKKEQERLKGIARTLYLNKRGITQKELAELVGVHSTTISKWCIEEQWDVLRQSLLTTKSVQLSRLYNFLDKATSLEKPNADDIAKLTTSIERLEIKTSIADIVSVAKDIVAYVSKIDLEKSKEITAVFDDFIQFKIKS